MTDVAPIETTLFDPVAADIDQLDLTNSLIVHSALRSLQDEVLYWRENMTCYLQDVVHQISEGRPATSNAFASDPWRRLRELSSVLDDALTGKVFQTCVSCGGDVRPGDMVIFYSDEGEAHASCVGATAEQIAAGKMPVPIDALDVSDLTETEIEAARADPSVTIYASSPYYGADRICEIAERARAMLADEEKRSESAEGDNETDSPAETAEGGQA